MFQKEFDERIKSRLVQNRTKNENENSFKNYTAQLDILAQEIASNNIQWNIPVNDKISSHRPLIGRLIVLGKRIVKRCLKWLVSMPLIQQREFNASVTRSINAIYRLNEKLIENSAKQQSYFDQLDSQHQKIVFLESQNKSLHELVLLLKEQQNQHTKAIGSLNDEFDKDSFPIDYVKFEDQFRGVVEIIKRDQLDTYLPYIGSAKKILDAGCGRGELLEGLQERGFDVKGIDLNKLMVSICENKGLPVQNGDFVQHLSESTENYDVIVSLHVVEHLKPRVLLDFLRSAYERLNMGGKIIVETPNPECLYNLAFGYSIDLTHKNMIHAYTLKFILEEIGFRNINIKHLAPVDENVALESFQSNEQNGVLNRNVDRINGLLFGYQNYAIIAEK